MRKLLLESLLKVPLTEPAPARDQAALAELAAAVDRAARARLGRSLSIRQVDAGSCNGCELEIHALANAFYDLERFGLRFVASPRHADVLLVTGPVTKNMREALERTYQATSSPKWVVAVGDCGIDGGVFKGSYAVSGGVDSAVPVDLVIRGCPPTPVKALRAPTLPLGETEIAVAWLLGQPGVSAPIVGASKLHHLDDSVKALGTHLTAEESQKLESPYETQPPLPLYIRPSPTAAEAAARK